MDEKMVAFAERSNGGRKEGMKDGWMDGWIDGKL